MTLLVIATALLSSVFTLLIVRWWIHAQLVPDLEERWEAAVSDLEGRLQTVADEAGEKLEQHVRSGVQGAFSDLTATEVLRRTTKGAFESGTGLVADGILRILGGPARKE